MIKWNKVRLNNVIENKQVMSKVVRNNVAPLKDPIRKQLIKSTIVEIINRTANAKTKKVRVRVSDLDKDPFTQAKENRRNFLA